LAFLRIEVTPGLRQIVQAGAGDEPPQHVCAPLGAGLTQPIEL
jgi:hypothetical protein